MRKGKASGTAQFVAYNRALANLAPVVPGFSDPVAAKLLRPDWVAKIEKKRVALAGSNQKSPFPFWFRGMGIFNQFRAVILDQAIRNALPVEQLVILGAGLDTRAWRLPELKSTIVFEVDHPDTQALKKDRINGLNPLAEEIRFVAVDFLMDDLVAELKMAGFNNTLPTFWLWEGVTMYLTSAEVARNFEIMASISSTGSRLALTYMARKNGKIPKSWFLALMGEPVRSAFSIEELAQMAEKSGWKTFSNTGIEDWKQSLTPGLALTERAVGMQWNERIWVGTR
jgi:methyltransferase (TIGR00027 family)